jgi:hypothetical protein
MVAANREDTVNFLLAFKLPLFSISKMCEDFIKLPEDEVASLGRLKEMSVVLIDCDGEGRVTHDDGGFEDIDNLIGCEIDDVYLRV